MDKLGRFVALMRQAIQQRIEWAAETYQSRTDDDDLLLKDISGMDEAEAREEQGE